MLLLSIIFTKLGFEDSCSAELSLINRQKVVNFITILSSLFYT